jgi:hypothetical protein
MGKCGGGVNSAVNNYQNNQLLQKILAGQNGFAAPGTRGVNPILNSSYGSFDGN